jgi:hypothetical protein
MMMVVMVMVVVVINSVLWSFAPKPQPRQLVETKCWASLFLATVLGLCCSEFAAPPQVASQLFCLDVPGCQPCSLFGLATATLLKRIHHSDSSRFHQQTLA